MSKFTQLNDAVNNNNDRDIISTLPELLISRILSLVPTKEAVRTCILSKDWEHKWIGIDTIDIYDGHKKPNSSTHNETYSNFIDKVFRLAPIKRVRLNKYCIVKVPDTNCFSRLTNMYLKGFTFYNSRSPNPRTRFVFTFPVLESLELKYCAWTNVESLEFDAPVLKTFKARECWFTGGICKIKLYGDMVETFEAKDLAIENIVLSESKSSNQLSSDRCYGLQARALLKDVIGLKYLNLSAAVFKGLSGTKGELPPLILDELEKLEICLERDNEAFLELLYAAPFLERLIVNTGPWSSVEFELESLPPCDMSELKEVQFHGCHGLNEHNNLKKYFLKNAPKLKKLSINGNNIVLEHDEEVTSRNDILSSAKK